MLIGGAAWIDFISLVSALVQKLAPDWVRARVLAVYLLVFQGALAAGSALWGAFAQHAGLPTALAFAGVGSMATIALGLVWRLPDTTVDVTPWNHWRMPVTAEELQPELEAAGPVLITVEYLVKADQVSEFVKAMNRYGRTRRRDGASRWGMYRDTENPSQFVETFIVGSWAEHLRQHQRFTRADHAVEERISSCTVGEPKVRHFIHT